MTTQHQKNLDSVIVIFGVSGDLAQKKILPALSDLFVDGTLAKTKIVGVARRDLTSHDVLTEAAKHMSHKTHAHVQALTDAFEYFSLDFSNMERYRDLALHIRHLQQQHALDNVLFYLSTSPEFYETILDNIKANNLHTMAGFTRVVLEKPFGHDLASALRINRKLQSVFHEDHIFRIDHYLAKDIVQDMIALRFSNRVFLPLWNKKNIDHIQIILSEDFGIRDRGAFYEKYGALKDVVQNHIVQILALAIMDNPGTKNDEFLRNQKIKILKKVRISDVVIGQYEGYHTEHHIDAHSKTETFAALKLFVSLDKWKSVPIYVMTGKQLPQKFAKVYVQFKESDSPFLDTQTFLANYLDFQIQPHEGFYLGLNARNPHSGDIIPVKMDYCSTCTFPNSPDAYAKLLTEVLMNNKMFFIRSDEVAAQWKIIDAINRDALPLHVYKQGTIPKAAHDLIEKDGRAWYLKIEAR